jgi:phosphate uptake regulator
MIVSDMITNEDKNISHSAAVSLAMYARYLKRINAHLTNIASAVVNPFPRIGFREKKPTSKSKSK